MKDERKIQGCGFCFIFPPSFFILAFVSSTVKSIID